MSKLVSIALAIAAALAVVSTSTPLFAAGPALEYRTAAVRYGDLNLATPEGAKALGSRVRGAVLQMCGPERSVPLVEHRVIRNCRMTAFDSARPQVERLLARHRPQVIIAASR